MKVAAEDLWPLVMDFLEEYYSKEDFKAFKKHFKLKVDTENDPYVEAGGMKAMLKCFLKNNLLWTSRPVFKMVPCAQPI